LRESDTSLVRGFPLFRGVSDDVVARVIANAQILDHSAGHMLLQEGQRPSSLFVLLNGLVETFSEGVAGTTTLAFVRPPAAFIVAAVWMDQPQLTSARTLVPSRILAIPASEVRSALASDRGFCAALGYEMAIRYRDVLKELKNQRMRNATERLANWLLTEAAVAGVPHFQLAIGKSTLAGRLGMTSEHLSRALVQLRQHGVETEGRTIRLDPERLASFAHPNPLIDGSDV
jgi:CRP/FNR family transcriptional activator FtrB